MDSLTDLKLMIFNTGLTQKELAERLGVSQVVVSNWVTGARNPREDNLENIRRISLGLKPLAPKELSVEELGEMINKIGGTPVVKKLCGVSSQSVYKWIKGECKPNKCNVARIRKASKEMDQ